MKLGEIQPNGKYLAKVSGKLVTVRVDAIRDATDFKGRAVKRFDVTNLSTNRRTTFRSAAKFRRVM
jgi:hypothetical protein